MGRAAARERAAGMAGKHRVEFSNRQRDMKADKPLRDLIRACCAQTLRREEVLFLSLIHI